LDKGAKVRALVRSDVRALEGLDVDLRKVDVTDRDGVSAAISGAEVVYHAAARLTLEAGEDPEAERVNVAGTRNVIAACERSQVKRLVHFSSAHALGKSGSLLADGEGRAYERSKALAEREVNAARERGLGAVIVSPAAVVGPFDHKPSYMGRVLLMLAKGQLPGTVNAGQSWVDVRDVASTAIAAADRGKPGVRYVVAGHWMAMPALAKLAARSAGVRGPLFSVSTGVAKWFAPAIEKASRMVGQEPLVTAASMDALEERPRRADGLAERDLGHTARPIERTLDDTFRWFEERGMLGRRRSADKGRN
jgi:dihydroflavonol-4-reductase